MSELPVESSLLVEAIERQPGLFSSLDVDAETVTAARSVIEHGRTTSQHTEHAAKIIAAACLGWSERRIARDLGHSRNTVAGVLRIAERAGKVEPVKERVLAAVAAAIHADIEKGNELAETAAKPDQISALAALRKSTWVGAGILADKGAAGQAASVVVNVGSGSVVQVVQDYAARLAAVSGRQNAQFPEVKPQSSVDCQSTGVAGAVIELGGQGGGGGGAVSPEGGK